MPIRVATLEDDPIVQSFLAHLLKSSTACEHAGAAYNKSQAIDLIEKNVADVYLVDMHLPDTTGVELIRHIKQRWPDAACLVLSSVSDNQRVKESIQAGAGGYLLKDDQPEALIEKIMAIHQGTSPLSPKIANGLLRDIARQAAPPPVTETVVTSVHADTLAEFILTKRELQILQKVNSLSAIKVVANELHISPFTVNQHLQNIYRKLGVKNRSAAIIKAHELKII